MFIEKQIVCSLFQTERVSYIQFGNAKVSPVCLILQLAVILRTILAILKVHAVQGVASLKVHAVQGVVYLTFISVQMLNVFQFFILKTSVFGQRLHIPDSCVCVFFFKYKKGENKEKHSSLNETIIFDS